MPESADLYEILQVHPSAYPEVIEAAYRRLAQIYHPDRNPAPDAEERMTEINRAYEVLRDPQKRAAYDRQRAGDESNGTGGGGASVADVISAKSFRLVNDAGQTRAELSLDQAGNPMLIMNDRSGNRRFRIFQGENGQQRLVISDRGGNIRLYIGESDDGRPMLFTIDSNGKRRFAIYQDEGGQQRLVINDQNGDARLSVGEDDNGRPTLYTTDPGWQAPLWNISAGGWSAAAGNQRPEGQCPSVCRRG